MLTRLFSMIKAYFSQLAPQNLLCSLQIGEKMKIILSLIFLFCCSTIFKCDEAPQVTVNENCDYFGHDFLDENNDVIKITGIDAEKCKSECIKKEQCTHYTSSEWGCFLKQADAKQTALDSKQDYPEAFCGYIESRFQS